MEVKSLRVIEKHQILMLAAYKQIRLKEAAKQLGLPLCHTKRLAGELREAGGDFSCLLFQRQHPAWNRLPQQARNTVVALKEERPQRSNPFIAELLDELYGIKVHSTTVRNILIETGKYTRSRERRRPAVRFEAKSFGKIYQMDSTSGAWLEGYRQVTLVLILDDYSRIIVAGHFMDSDSTYNNMLVIREAIEKYGLFSLFYIDNDSKFKVIRHGNSRFFDYEEETLTGETITEIHRALLELGIVLLPHEKDVAQAKGKIERIFRFIQERFILEHTATTLEELDQQFQKWIEWYNTCHINRDTGVVPRARLQPSVTKLLPYGLNLDDAFCFKEERKVAKDTSQVVPSLLQDKRCHSSFSTTD
jgi:transposase InsO family protein